MRKLLFISIITLLFSCSKDDEPDRTMYNITYTVTATNGATINKVEYRDSQGKLIELTNVNSPWTINLNVRAGLGLEAVAYGDIPYQGSLSITAVWVPEGGDSQSETDTLGNNTPDSTINNGKVEISGRTLPD
ncbi:hypothetical protein SAMN06265371_101218 [Lutibacter agarilyticus]|uniref:MmpS family membrane protein n=1 Tax=Lutibacter agarilyticus TaxID=1109740 RepID=A0A238VEC3_9FLAO|nr:hypothetical protein [Lutibacter agarilyticus]SNR32033.1 hypothetical protein SAMN06265371_101218 [Lutibacter agarilyticus]